MKRHVKSESMHLAEDKVTFLEARGAGGQSREPKSDTAIKLGQDYIGDRGSLLGTHGMVDVDKAIRAIQFRAEVTVVDIKKINETAETGLLYLDEKGIALDGVTKADEKKAKYKLVPIGYTDRFTTNEICASFMKGGFAWEGIFVGTVDKLIERIMHNFEERIGRITPREKSSAMKFRGNFILKGFGLGEIMKNNKNTQYAPGFSCRVKLVSQVEPDAKIADVISEENKNKLINIQTPLGVRQNATENKVEIPVIKERTVARTENRSRNIYDDVFDRLLIKENWKASSKNRLSFYVKSLLEKIACEQGRNESVKGNGYTLSESREKCIFNTGLIDIYNNDVYLIDLNNNEPDFFKKEIIMAGSKASATAHGFNKADVLSMPKPIKFYSDKKDLVFDGCIEEFDLEDNSKLNHIIQERRSRFPLGCQTIPSDVLCEKVKSAVSKAVRLSERDYRYIVPMYNLKLHRIQYLMPLHLETSIEDSPELVIVVGENNGFYCVYTILTTDDAYDNARLLCRPDSNWLRVKTD